MKTRITLAGLVLALGVAFAPAAFSAEIAIAPPPISNPSYAEPGGRFDFTYIGFDEIDGEGFGFSFNTRESLSEHSGFALAGGFYGISIGDGDTTGTIFNLGLNYEHRLIGVDAAPFTLIGFLGPLVNWTYFETCTGFGCTEFDQSLYGGQAGLQAHFGVDGSMQVAPFVVSQSLSGSDVDTITTTSIGVDLLFGDWSLSGALNQTEDDDITIISVGYRW